MSSYFLILITMTVISGMKVNNADGILVADEQTSYGSRKSNIAVKLDSFELDNKNLVITGGTGASDILYNITSDLKEGLKKDLTNLKGKDIIDNLSSYAKYNKRAYLNAHLQDKYGISENEFQSGMNRNGTPISPNLIQTYTSIVESHGGEMANLFQSTFLSLALTDNSLELYRLSMNNSHPMPIARPYETVGSGSDIADYIISSYLESIPREERENISKIDGISTLLDATYKASLKNAGVGGTPLIAIVNNGKIITPTQYASKLASEIVQGSQKGYLNKEFQQEALKSLLYDNGDVDIVEKAMWKDTKDNQMKLSRLLRQW